MPALFEALVVHHYFGRADAPEDLRRPLLSGEALAAVATSEPEVGASPKHLAARAARAGSGWRLSGIKSPVTHGLDASVFLVLAITGEEAGRRRFSVFAVPRSAGGLSVEPLPGAMAGHARVRFDAVQSLTTPQKLQACTNLGIGDPEANFAAAYATAKV